MTLQRVDLLLELYRARHSVLPRKADARDPACDLGDAYGHVSQHPTDLPSRVPAPTTAALGLIVSRVQDRRPVAANL
jgi:hypothetical protein